MVERKTVFTVAERIAQAHTRIPILERIIRANFVRCDLDALTDHTVQTVMQNDPSLGMTIHRFLRAKKELAELVQRDPNEIADISI